MGKDNVAKLGILEITGTGSFYGYVNSEFVESHINELYKNVKSKFEDDRFIEILKSLKPKAQTTIELKLYPQENCFANKLWFRIRKSSSTYGHYYMIDIGVNYKSDMFCPLSKSWVKRCSYSNLETLIERINDTDKQEKWSKVLLDNIFNGFFDAYTELLSQNKI